MSPDVGAGPGPSAADAASFPRTILLTGLMAAGKSSVAQALAERIPRSVHLRGDAFRRMIVNGRAEMGFELSSEAREQLLLRYRIAAGAAHLYLRTGFTVVYQDIILGPDLADVADLFRGTPLSVVVLCPRSDVVAVREAARSKTGYPHESLVYEFDRAFRTATPRLGYWIDSSDLTVPETVDRILAHLPEAAISG